MEKILITGTGRSGTTFLMIILTLLNMDTGFNKENYEEYISTNCNSGLENFIDVPYQIIKKPSFIYEIENMIIKDNLKIKYVIIPIRDNQQVSLSRKNNKNYNGGLWNAIDYESQIIFNNKIIYDYICNMTKYDIPTIFLNFEKMINDSKYLYEKLKPILENTTFDDFNNAFNLATENQKKERTIPNELKSTIMINQERKKEKIKIKNNKLKKNKLKNNKLKKTKLKNNKLTKYK